MKSKIKSIQKVIDNWYGIAQKIQKIADDFANIKDLEYEYIDFSAWQSRPNKGAVVSVYFMESSEYAQNVEWQENDGLESEMVLTAEIIANPEPWLEKVKKQTMAEVL